MKFLRIILITSLIAFYSEAQESEAPPTNLDQLLELVKEGKSKEQAANKKREEEFKRSRNNQARILQEEKDELKRQEDIADALEEEAIDYINSKGYKIIDNSI